MWLAAHSKPPAQACILLRAMQYLIKPPNILNNERVCWDNKTEKAQEQDWDGILAAKLN